MPLVVVGVAYLVAAAIVYALAKQGHFRATGQATAILIVLMFGAGTDYCLLLLARYRDELATTDDPHEAMATALKRTGPAIVSAGGIVVVVMLVLGIADYNATRWMGPVLAVGTAVTVLAGITLLPALLSAVGSRALKARPARGTLWPRIGALVRARPAALAAAVLAVLLVGSLGNLRDRETLDFSEEFRSVPQSVEGLRRMQAKFPPGQAGPAEVVVDSGTVSDVLPKLSGFPDTFSADLVAQSVKGHLALVRLTSNLDPFTEAGRRHDPGAAHVRDRGGARARPISSAVRRPRSTTPRRRSPPTRSGSCRSPSRSCS